MTPKEKAEELVDKMYNTEHCGIEHFPNKNYCDCVEINYHQAKQCALIAVDEVQQLIKDLSSCKNRFIYIIDEMNYWQEVKQEIEKL